MTRCGFRSILTTVAVVVFGLAALGLSGCSEASATHRLTPYRITLNSSQKAEQLRVVDGEPLPSDFLVVFLDLRKPTKHLKKKKDPGAGPEPFCSGVAVGRHVLLTAAHCVDDGEVEIVIKEKKKVQRRTGKCKTPPSHGSNQETLGCKKQAELQAQEDPDIALCHFDDPFDSNWVETIDTGPKLTPLGTKIYVTGNGCKSWNCFGKTSPNPGYANGGPTQVTTTPAADDLWIYTKGKASLCPGDSGGPVLVDLEKNRRVIGVGSTGCVDCDPLQSSVARLSPKKVVDWMCQWVASYSDGTINGLSCPP